ncbi:TonB-dependent receptor domain-containing protein [Aegicerativicinus sediminis]|uniref:TonB-dependent receptor domain-containing protein n=1 Tax=Aegicerativicinus sediminis TaxID=2893202 RepID=UPI001E5B651A|nr:outer membrane beta-barrel family protein [Aegicerativicinus sediminis]
MTQTYIRYFLILFFFSTAVYSQNFQISGFVVDENEKGLSYANVVLKQAGDDSILTGTTSDENGFYLISNIPEGSYIVNVSFIGYQEENFPITVDRQIEMGVIQLSEITEALDEVNIIVKRPTITKEADRLTFNVANTALIEGSTLNVLKSTPSLLVIGGNITVKNNATEVYINGRKVHLSNQELTEFLENTPANSISNIEIITNPPASFDASSGTVVNIVMGKNLNPGYSGNVFVNYTQGVYPRYNAGTSHFFKGEKTEFNVAYSYNQNKINTDNNYLINYRDLNDGLEEIWFSDFNRTRWSKTHNANTNFNYNFNDRNQILVSANASYTPADVYIIDSKSDVYNPNGDYIYGLNTINNSDRDKLTASVDANYRVQFENDSKLSFNNHFTYYNYDDFQDVDNDYINTSNSVFDSSAFYSDANQQTYIITSGLDYTSKASEIGVWELGGKASFISTDSYIDRFDEINGLPEYNTNFSNAFDYNETVLAGYLNYSKDWDKLELNLGLRAEQTVVKGVSENTAENTDQDYFKLFPNASISYQISDNTSIYGNYKKSIDRPSYELLNPFSIYLNENTIATGNPNLRPAFVDRLDVGISFLEYFIIEAYYTKEKGRYYELPLQDNASKSTIYTPLNIGSHRDIGLDFYFMSSIGDRGYLSLITSFYNINEDIILAGNRANIEQWSNLSIANTTWALLKDRSLNLSASITYYSKAITSFSTVDARLLSNISISKKLLNGKGILSLEVGDLFNTEDYRWVTRYLNQDTKFTHDQDTRYVKVGFRYNFGNTGLNAKEVPEKSDEQKRLDKIKE